MSKKPAKTYAVRDNRDPFSKALDQLYSSTETDKIVKRMDAHQKAYYLGTKEKRVSIVDAKAGTGKTTVAFASGLDALRAGGINKLMYIRFPDDEIQSLGFLPGDIDEKGSSYFGPAYNTLAKCGIQYEATDMLRDKGTFEFVMANTLRGSDYENAFVIIDEAQNARDKGKLQTVLTRFHDNCKLVLIGHSEQQDNREIQKYGGLTAFQAYQVHLLKKRWTQKYDLIVDYRGELCRWSDEIEETLRELV